MTTLAGESRYLAVNRRHALRRMRKRIARDVRTPFDLDQPDLPPEFVAQRTAGGALAVNPRNSVYPVVVATVLDALAAAGFSYAPAAKALGITTSQFARFLRDDREVWRAVRESRGTAANRVD